MTENNGRKQRQKGKYLEFEGATKHPIENELRIGKRFIREADFESSASRMYLTKQKKAHRKEKINSAKTFEILEENVAYGVEQNITSYRDTEKKAVYFVGTQV